MSEDVLNLFTPADFAQRAQDILHAELSERIAEILKEEWGVGWTDTLNRKIVELNKRRLAKDPSASPRKLIKIENGRPRWDFAEMLKSFQASVADFPRFTASHKKIATLCSHLIGGRIDLAHKDDRSALDAKFAKRHISILIDLLRTIGGTAKVEEAKTLLAHIDKLGARTGGIGIESGPPSKVAGSKAGDEIKQIRSMLEDLVVKSEGAESPPPGNRSQERAAFEDRQKPQAAPLVAAEAASGGRRRTAIPPPQRGVVLFPIVDGGANAVHGSLGYISCATYRPESRQDIVSLIVGFEGHGRSDLYYQAISDARYTEADHAKAALYTRAKIDPGNFGGNSFTLAAAIADKTARYGLPKELAGKFIIATGALPKGGRGEIAAIDSFEGKLAVIEREAPPASILLLPAANLTPTTQRVLERLQASGRISWRAISHVGELDGWFSPASEGDDSPERISAVAVELGGRPVASPVAKAVDPKPAPPVPNKRFGLAALVVAAALTGVALLAGVYFVSDRQVATRADPVQQEQARLAIAKLNELGAAVRASPDDARPCIALRDSGNLLSEMTQRLFREDHERVTAEMQQCASQLAASDRRLAELRAATDSLDPNLTGTMERMASARKQLTAFDLTRMSPDERPRLVGTGDQAQARLAESDRRIKPLLDAHAAWRTNGSAVTMRALGEADRSLSDFDRSRAVAGLREALRDAEKARSDLAASAARWSALQAAIDRTGREPIEFYYRPLRNAVESINSFDLEIATPAQRHQVTQARQLLNASAVAPPATPTPSTIAPLQRRRNDDFGTIPSR
jgi:hypothetical protein